MMRITHRIIFHPRGILSACLLGLPLLLAGCGDAEEEAVVEDVAQTQEPEVPTREDTEVPEPEVPVMQDPDLDVPEGEEQQIGAVAKLQPTEGNTAEGEVTFRYEGDVVVISGNITGLEPGPHGFHVHETGDCSAPDASSAGGHFNPGDAPHGSPSRPADEHHVGDFGNIEANAEGVAHFDISEPEMSLGDHSRSVIGRAVIVHAGKDDLTSQPSGDAGARVACGVIEKAQVPD